jgi:hypothetical protein
MTSVEENYRNLKRIVAIVRGQNPDCKFRPPDLYRFQGLCGDTDS